MSGTRTQTVTTTAPAGTRLRRTAVQQTRAYDHLYDTTYTTGATAHARANAAATNTRTVRLLYTHEWPISVLNTCNPHWSLLLLELLEQRGQSSHTKESFFCPCPRILRPVRSVGITLSHSCVHLARRCVGLRLKKVYNMHLLCVFSTTPSLSRGVPRMMLFFKAAAASMVRQRLLLLLTSTQHSVSCWCRCGFPTAPTCLAT